MTSGRRKSVSQASASQYSATTARTRGQRVATAQLAGRDERVEGERAAPGRGEGCRAGARAAARERAGDPAEGGGELAGQVAAQRTRGAFGCRARPRP